MTTIQEVKNNVDVDEEMNKDLLLKPKPVMCLPIFQLT